MKSIKFELTVDSLGRVVLPALLRKRLQLEANSKVDAFWDEQENRIYIEKFKDNCVACGSETGLRQLQNGVFLCEHCLNGAMSAI